MKIFSKKKIDNKEISEGPALFIAIAVQNNDDPFALAVRAANKKEAIKKANSFFDKKDRFTVVDTNTAFKHALDILNIIRKFQMEAGE